ncbi:MAG TPA: hypothetical protein VFZ01_08945 [Geminicoccaceae bacterium]
MLDAIPSDQNHLVARVDDSGLDQADPPHARPRAGRAAEVQPPGEPGKQRDQPQDEN